MKIVIVGAGGLVGKGFTRHLSLAHQVLSLTHSDLDITDTEGLEHMVFAECPDLVINCAVLGVDACTLDPMLAWSVNVVGAENLAKTSEVIGAEFLQISSNFVFDGKNAHDSFYTIKDVPAPINVYGETKLAGERAVVAACSRTFIIRTSWVFGADKGGFFTTAPLSLRARKKIRAITDVWASATFVSDLASRVSEILRHRYYSTYHVVNRGLCSYHDFAVEAARVLELPESELVDLIEPTELSDLCLPARRPHYTPMSCIVSEHLALAPMRDWRLALAEFLL